MTAEIHAGDVLQHRTTGRQILVKRRFNGKIFGVTRKSGRGRWSRESLPIEDLTGYEPVD